MVYISILIFCSISYIQIMLSFGRYKCIIWFMFSFYWSHLPTVDCDYSCIDTCATCSVGNMHSFCSKICKVLPILQCAYFCVSCDSANKSLDGHLCLGTKLWNGLIKYAAIPLIWFYMDYIIIISYQYCMPSWQQCWPLLLKYTTIPMPLSTHPCKLPLINW